MLLPLSQLCRRSHQSFRLARTPISFGSHAHLYPRETRPVSSTFAVYNNASRGSQSGRDKPIEHTTDTYAKDEFIPSSDSSVYQVDSNSDAVQRPFEAVSGEWSRAGTQTEEYRHVDHEEPYDAPAEDGEKVKGERLRYGGKEQYGREKAPETSQPDDGPQGKPAGGHKPEGRT